MKLFRIIGVFLLSFVAQAGIVFPLAYFVAGMFGARDVTPFTGSDLSLAYWFSVGAVIVQVARVEFDLKVGAK